MTVITTRRVLERLLMKIATGADRERLERLMRFLLAYESGEITVERLISAIEIEYKSLSSVEIPLRRQIEQKWIELEIEFATALANHQSELTDEQVRDILKIIAALRDLLKPALD